MTRLYGGAGNDTLTDDQGTNTLDGGDGNDNLTAKSLTAIRHLSVAAGTTTSMPPAKQSPSMAAVTTTALMQKVEFTKTANGNIRKMAMPH